MMSTVTDQRRQSRRLSFTLQIQRILSVDKQGNAKQTPDPCRIPPRSASIDVPSAPAVGSDAIKAERASIPRPLPKDLPSGLIPCSHFSEFHGINAKSPEVLQAPPALTGPDRLCGQPSSHKEACGTASQQGEVPTEANNGSDRTEICISPSWHHNEERRKRRKEAKRMERDQRELEKRLKKLEEAEPKGEVRSSKRESRRLTKKQPLGSSSRASSVNTEASRSSRKPILSIFSGSTRASRSNSLHEPDRQHAKEKLVESARSTRTSDITKTESSSTTPRLSGTWPERFGAAISRDLASGNRRAYANYSPASQSKPSLHSTTKSVDLRGSAKFSQAVDSEGDELHGSQMSFCPRPVSSKTTQSHAKNSAEHGTLKAGTSKPSADLDRLSFAAALNLEKRAYSQGTPKRPRFITEAEQHSDRSSNDSNAASASDRMLPSENVKQTENHDDSASIERSNASVAAENGARVSSYSKVRGTDHLASNVRTSALSTYTREELWRNPIPQVYNGNQCRHTMFKSSPLAMSSTSSRDLEGPDRSKTEQRSSPTDKSKRASHRASLSLNVGATEDSHHSKPKTPRKLSLRLRRKEKKESHPHRPSRIPESGQASSSDSVDQTSTLTATEKSVNVDIRVPERSPLRTSVDASSMLPSSAPCLNSSVIQGHLETRGPTSGHLLTPPPSATSKDKIDRGSVRGDQVAVHIGSATTVGSLTVVSDTVQKRGHLSQQSVAPQLPEFSFQQPPFSGPMSGSGKLSWSSSSQEAMSDGYNTAQENVSVAESLEQIPLSQSSNHTPSVSVRNESDDRVPRPGSNPQAYNTRTPSHPNNTPASAMHSTASLLTTGSSKRTRHSQQAKPLAKIFVICCRCKFWHDMPSELYAMLAFPDGLPGSQHSSSSTTLVSRERPATGSAPISSNRCSISSNAPGSGVRCCWCSHDMTKSCCEGWTTIVYKHERLH